MTTSSARPALLDEAVDRQRVVSNHLEDVAQALRGAMNAYDQHCTDYELRHRSDVRARMAANSSNLLFERVHEIAEAFRAADRRPGGFSPAAGLISLFATVETTDVAVSNALAARWGATSEVLTAPTRALVERGRAFGRRLGAEYATKGSGAAAALLAEPESALLSDLAEPFFAAAVMRELGPDRIVSITGDLAARSWDWTIRVGPLADFARLWTTATYTLDSAGKRYDLDNGVLTALATTTVGRNTLRTLSATADQPISLSYLRRVRSDLIDRSASDDVDFSNTSRFLNGADREGHPDVPLLSAVLHTPGATSLLFGEGSTGSFFTAEGIEPKVGRLLDLGQKAQPTVAALLGQLLDEHGLDPDTGSERARVAVLRSTYSWVIDNGAAAVGEPFAQFLADTVVSDTGFYLGRADTTRRGDMATFFEAVTVHERPWMTALVGIRHDGHATIRETLHSPLDLRVAALDDHHRIADAFEDGAARSDRPVEQGAMAFVLVGLIADEARSGVATKMSPLAGRALGMLVDAALAKWRDSVQPEPGTHEDKTRMIREGLRRETWVAIANDSAYGDLIRWQVGGPETMGSRITGIEDLLAMDGSDTDIDELDAWASHQPRQLQALVDTYLSGLDG